MTSGPQILIGSSMGGWIAIKIGLLNPKKIKGICEMCKKKYIKAGGKFIIHTPFPKII